MKLSKAFIKNLSLNERDKSGNEDLYQFFSQFKPWKFDEFIRLQIINDHFAKVLQNFRPADCEDNPTMLNWVGDDIQYLTNHINDEDVKFCLESLDYLQSCYNQ